MRDKIITSVTSLSGISAIEIIHQINISEILKFSIETTIGILTIIYLVLKIKKLYNEKSINNS